MQQSQGYLFLGKAETARPTKATFELVNKKWNHQDFLHTVRGVPYHELRRAIDNAFNEHTTINLSELKLDHPAGGSGHYVNLTIMIMPVENSAPELAVITAHDITDQVQIRKRLDAVQREHAELVG